MRVLTLAMMLIVTPGAGAQDPDAGVSKALAASRVARVSDVRYALRFEVAGRAERATGQLVLTFSLPDDDRLTEDLVLDFGGETLVGLRVNGQPLDDVARVVGDHVVLPAASLTQGSNVLEARFATPIAATGTPLTRYRDPTDGAEYLYTLVVPADAHRLFPCFDQPDLKATFELTLFVPSGWTAVSNATATNDPVRGDYADVPREQEDGRRAFTFAPTKPLSTYLFAFATGPFTVIEDDVPSGIGTDPNRPIRMFVRPSRRPFVETERLFAMHRDALRWLGTWFATPYPFDKLDVVLVPGFPYGGMEHAGAIFYRETALSFEREPTDSEQLRRSSLVYHEVAHQWFGNLVTMVWFDDLWLKEGFATFLGYTLVEALEPGRNAWLRFHQRVKPRAYDVDVTAGTTPIYQELSNLANAKSAYGPIVYNKAPAVLRELEARMGKDAFRSGVRLFVQRHAYGNATWRDLVDALTTAGSLRDARWSDRWILGRGMPRVRAEWTVGEDGLIATFAIVQSGPDGSAETWPLSFEVLLLDRDGGRRRVSVRTDTARSEVAELAGQPAPAAVLLNPTDVAYGLFLLDPLSRDHLVEHAHEIDDPMTRAIAVSALFQTTREAALDPRVMADLLIQLVTEERDPDTHDWLLGQLGTVLGRWLTPEAAGPLRGRVEEALRAQLAEGREGTALQTFQFLAWNGRSPQTRALLRGVLDGGTKVAGLALEARDRFVAAAALLASGDVDAVERETKRAGDRSDVAKWRYMAGAAGPTAESKAEWFATYEQLDEPPEQWMQDSLPFFHWPGQEQLTLPYLRRALDRVDWVKRNRKIFYMPAWIDAFVNGHASPEALEIVVGFLKERTDLEPDIRAKILQSVDSLERAVRVKERFP